MRKTLYSGLSDHQLEQARHLFPNLSADENYYYVLADDETVIRRDRATNGAPARNVQPDWRKNDLIDRMLAGCIEIPANLATVFLFVGLIGAISLYQLGHFRLDGVQLADPYVVLILEGIALAMACWGLLGLVFGRHTD